MRYPFRNLVFEGGGVKGIAYVGAMVDLYRSDISTLQLRKEGSMFGSAILDVAIGLISIFLFLSLIGTAINEWVSGILRMRPKNLEEGIRNILMMIGSSEFAAGSSPLLQYPLGLRSGLICSRSLSISVPQVFDRKVLRGRRRKDHRNE